MTPNRFIPCSISDKRLLGHIFEYCSIFSKRGIIPRLGLCPNTLNIILKEEKQTSGTAGGTARLLLHRSPSPPLLIVFPLSACFLLIVVSPSLSSRSAPPCLLCPVRWASFRVVLSLHYHPPSPGSNFVLGFFASFIPFVVGLCPSSSGYTFRRRVTPFVVRLCPSISFGSTQRWRRINPLRFELLAWVWPSS